MTRSTTYPRRAAIYARVSTLEQAAENQLAELRRYGEARGWATAEYVDAGVSGAKDRRLALDALLRDAKQRRFDVLVCWRLDRLGRNLRHLVTLIGHRHDDAHGAAAAAWGRAARSRVRGRAGGRTDRRRSASVGPGR